VTVLASSAGIDTNGECDDVSRWTDDRMVCGTIRATIGAFQPEDIPPRWRNLI
jgi:hypothetical protein